MFTNSHDLAIHIRKVLSDRNGKINPVRNLTVEEFRIAGDIIDKAGVPLVKGFLEYEPGRCSMVRLMNQIDLPLTLDAQVLPFRPRG